MTISKKKKVKVSLLMVFYFWPYEHNVFNHVLGQPLHYCLPPIYVTNLNNLTNYWHSVKPFTSPALKRWGVRTKYKH